MPDYRVMPEPLDGAVWHRNAVEGVVDNRN
jgi:hypothetical protein